MSDPIATEVDLVTLYEIYPKIIEDLFFMDTALLAHFRAKALVPFHGGAFMQNVFSYAPMVVGSYAKGANWNINKRQTLAGTRFEPKYYAAIIPEYEEDIEVTNKGELAVFKLIDTDLRNGMSSISAATAVAMNNHGQAAVASTIYGNHPNDMNGWPEAMNDGVLPGWDGSIFSTYGTATRNGVIGSKLNSSPYWCGGTDGSTGLITYPKMNTTYLQCSRGKQQPNLGVGNKSVIGFIEDRIQPQQRFAQEQDPYWGVSGLKMKNAIIMHDDYFPSVIDGVNDPDLGNYLVGDISYTAPSTIPSGSNFPASCTLKAGEVFAWFNTDKWLFRISDSKKYGYGASGFVPAQMNSRVVCVIRAAINLECLAPWANKQLLGIGG
jgi:hypothetical protein